MRAIAELTSGEQAHLFVRGLTLAHMDATLKQIPEARRFLDEDIVGDLRTAAWRRRNIIGETEPARRVIRELKG